MPARVRLPTPLRGFSQGQSEISVDADTVGTALGQVVASFPRLRPHLFTEAGELRPFVTAYLNQDNVRDLTGFATPVRDGDSITIVPSIAGGAPGPDEAAWLTPAEHTRYGRQLLLPEFGMPGQLRLKAARVLCVGTGGLGSPLAMYLAAAGVGTLGLVDFDVVDESNLHRQILHGTADVGRPKLASAADRLQGVNPLVRIVRHDGRLTAANAREIVSQYDVVADGTDNFPARFLVNDACVLLGKPNVHAAIFRFEGQLTVFDAERGPCYRCLYREPPPPDLVPSCAEAGVLGVLPGVLGTLQALEVIKVLTGMGEPAIGRLVLFDALELSWQTLRVRKDAGCPLCGPRRSITQLTDYAIGCAAGTGPSVPGITVKEFRGWVDAGSPYSLVDVREPHEWQAANLEAFGARLIPLADLGRRLNELNPRERWVVYCRSGARSAKAVRQLRDAGFADVLNLEGGMLAWQAASSAVPTLKMAG